MLDLDQLLDSFAADVKAATRPPGASTAIRKARQRRRAVTSTAAALTVVALGGAVAGGFIATDDQAGHPVDPATSSPSPSTPASITASPGTIEYFEAKVRSALTSAPGWAVADRDSTILSPCTDSWAPDAGGSGGSFSVATPGRSAYVFSSDVFFTSAAAASEAVTSLVATLESCSSVGWLTQPIANTGGVLASTTAGVVWIHRKGSTVATLQVPTNDGPPPLDVQVEVAQLVRGSIR